MFYMCLYGYSTQQIADILTRLQKKTYLGNAKWTAGSVLQTLRNERYCGDVFTRKTFTRDVLSHKVAKNRGERPRSRYLDEHTAIVSRDDYIAVQMLLNNTKYRNRSFLPELEVISDGLLKGFVVINPRWGSFTEEDYLKASGAAYGEDAPEEKPAELTVEADEGDFDYSGYEIAQLDLAPNKGESICTIDGRTVVFNVDCINRMNKVKTVELLVHPGKHELAVRPAAPDSRNAVQWIRNTTAIQSRLISASAFSPVILSLFGWDPENRYRLFGTHYHFETEDAVIFSTSHAAVMIKENRLQAAPQEGAVISPLLRRGKRIGAVAGDMADTFGLNFYEEQTTAELIRQTPENWQIRLKGRLCGNGNRLNITPYEELKAFIQEELGELFWEEDINGQRP